MLCHGYKPADSWLSWKDEHGKGKWKYSKDIFKNCQRTGNSKVLNSSLAFSLMFHFLNDFYTLIFFNDFQDNCVCLYLPW